MGYEVGKSWKTMENEKNKIWAGKSHGKGKFGKKSLKNHGILNFSLMSLVFFEKNGLVTYIFKTL